MTQKKGIIEKAKSVSIVLLILLLLFPYAAKKLGIDLGEETTTVIETVIVKDTIIIHDTIVKWPKPTTTHDTTFIELPAVIDTVIIDGEVIQVIDTLFVKMPINEYSDSTRLDSIDFIYKMRVRGFIEEFKYRFNVPYSEKETRTDKTTVKSRFVDLYLNAGTNGIGAPEGLRFTAGPDFIFKKFKIGYRVVYDPTPGIEDRYSHGFEFGTRLIGF